ncbi:MAG TPA: glycosyltransferase family 39 protein [Gaiellaceae bacterium]|nr:glycosyltransferase family 39 protein [Gaiellaceae bacterium]
MSGRLLAALIGITLGGAALRFATLDVQSYWFDEVVTVGLTSMSFGEMLDELRITEATPPGYYAVAWLWAKAFGTGAVGLRSLSAVAGTLFIPVAYATAATLVSRRAGLLTAALAATSPILVWYSQEARSYMLMVLATGVSLLFFARALRDPTLANLAGWTAFSAASLAIHYFAVFVVIAEAVALFALQRPRWRIVAATVPIALVGLLLLPLLREQSVNPTWIQEVPLRLRLEDTVRQLVTPAPLPAWAGASDLAFDSHSLWWLALAVLAAATVLVIRVSPPLSRRGALVALGIGVATVLAPVLVGAAGELVTSRADYLLSRNVLSAWLPFAIALATGFGAPRLGWLGVGAVATICTAGLAVILTVAVDEEWQRDDWRAVVKALPRDAPVLLAVPSYQASALSYYDPRWVNADDAGSTARRVVVVRRDGFGLKSLALPPSFERVARERLGRWEILTFGSASPAFVPPQPGHLVRMESASPSRPRGPSSRPR